MFVQNAVQNLPSGMANARLVGNGIRCRKNCDNPFLNRQHQLRRAQQYNN